MRYRHFARFQFILQDALRSAKGHPLLDEDGDEHYVTDKQYIELLELEGQLTAKALSTFRHSKLVWIRPNGEEELSPEKWPADVTPDEIKSPLHNRKVALVLWNDLYKRGHIKPALDAFPKVLTTKTAFTRSEAASTLGSFYGAHDSQIHKFVSLGLGGNGSESWFCYKRSFLKPGYVLKSRMAITGKRDHFSLYEKQIAATVHEGTEVSEEEESTGFAFSKSHRLWCFLREEQAEQPRIFCFHKLVSPPYSSPDDLQANFGIRERRLIVLLGHMIETGMVHHHGFFSSPVALTLPRYEAHLWTERKNGRPFDLNGQINIHPFTVDEDRLSPDFFIPDAVRSHLLAKSGAPESL